MRRVVCAGLGALAVVVACRLPPDRQVMQPLPENGQEFAYSEILSRARAQATTALEAFYVDNWTDLETVASSLEQSARFLPRATQPPAAFKDKIGLEADILKREAERLRAAAKARDVAGTAEALQRIHFKIRALKPPDK